MKTVIIIPDGCADEPLEELGGKTPLQAAELPAMDEVAAMGVVGAVDNVPSHLPAGSEVANMSLLGYDPNRYFTGRAPIEAAARGIVLHPGDWAVRCNLVHIVEQVMVDFTAGHIRTEEAAELLGSLQEATGDRTLEFVSGVSYRNLLIARRAGGWPVPFSPETRTLAPHDLTDLPVSDAYPRGPGSDLLSRIMEVSHSCFADHPVNLRRAQQGLRTATEVWLWGQGQSPQLPPFAELFGTPGATPRGVMITAVDLLRGLAALVGWDRREVEGATGYLDTDYGAKGRAAIECLDRYDVVCVHIEAPDEASHEGRVDAKIEALESIDSKIVGPLHRALRERGPYRLVVTPDHPTPVATKKHSHGLVPVAVCGTGIAADQWDAYHELHAQQSSLRWKEGWRMMGCLMNPQWDGSLAGSV